MRTPAIRAVLLVIVLLFADRAPAAQECFVAPDGKPQGDGSRAAPCDLQTALNGPAWLKPGATVWLLGGEYVGAFEQKEACRGMKELPIVFRVAKGARATLVGGLSIHGSHTRFLGFEVTNPNRVADAASFLNFYGGDDVALINLVIHDNGVWEVGHNGIGCWSKATNAEVYGCLVGNCGVGTRKLSPSAHGIYTQNIHGTGTKRIENNIFFRVAGFGIHAYGSAKASVDDFVINNNIVFRNGAYGVQIGGGSPSRNITFEANCLYGNASVALAVGSGGGVSKGLSLRGNHIVGAPRSRLLLQVDSYEDAVITGNTFCALEAGPLVGLRLREGQTPPAGWNGNTYRLNKTFSAWSREEPRLFALAQGRFLSFEEWQGLGVDRASSAEGGKPKESWILIFDNQYQPGRANVAVYNWEGTAAMDLDLARVLVKDKPYLVLDAQDYFGKPLAAGVWRGGRVSVPMPHADPGPDFAALVVLAGEAIDYSGRGAK